MGFSASAFWSALLGGALGTAAMKGLMCVISKYRCRKLPPIHRLRTEDPRCSAVVIRDGLVYITGQVADPPRTFDIVEQTAAVLQKIDFLLEEAGTNKSRIIESRIWLSDIIRNFDRMNSVWNEWVVPDSKGVRYCVESRLAKPDILVEIQVVASL